VKTRISLHLALGSGLQLHAPQKLPSSLGSFLFKSLEPHGLCRSTRVTVCW
jgi:hypothetical protein